MTIGSILFEIYPGNRQANKQAKVKTSPPVGANECSMPRTQARERESECAVVLAWDDAMTEATSHLSRSPQTPPRAHSFQRGYTLAPWYEAGSFPKFDWNVETLEVN